MKPNRLWLAVASSLMASQLMAGEAVFYVTEEGEAVRDLAVSVNGQKKLVGKSGFVSFTVDGGSHTVELSKYGEFWGEFDFETANADQNAEIQVEMIGGEALPEVNVYTPGNEEVVALGQISGYLVSDDTGGAIAGARVSVEGTEQGVVTDEDGFFSFELARGEYNLLIADPNYGQRDVSAVRVMANVNTGVNLNMSLDGEGVIEEVVAVGSYIPSTATAQERDSSAVLDSIGSEQMARFGDSSAASALKRVAGVSVIGGQFAVVRGLQGRYLSSTLNGSLMPSTDPMRRDVPLDLFPASVLGGIDIQKSYTPDLPGDTTGGAIRMTTKELPDGRVNKLKITTGLNTRTTGSEVSSYRGGGSDFLGFDDGDRELPGVVDSATNNGQSPINVCNDPSLCFSQAEAADLGKAFSNNYNERPETAGPDLGLSYAYGDLVEMDERDLGYYGALQYSDKTRARHDAREGNFEYERTKRNVDVSGYFVIGTEDSEGNTYLSKTTLLRKSDDTSKVKKGEDNEGTEIEEYSFQWVERQFLSQQFSGEHFIGENHELDWRMGYSQTSRYEPDRRSYQYRDGIIFPSTLERRFSDLSENSLDFGLDYTFDYFVNDSVSMKLKAGTLISQKDRTVELARFGVRQSGNVNGDLESVMTPDNFDSGIVTLQVNTTKTDSYDAKDSMTAFYAMSEIDLMGGEYTVLAGARYEDASQELSYPNFSDSDNTLDSSDVLPVINVTWRANEELQFRAGVSQTLSRPGITERSDSQQYDPETDDEIFGNPDLEISKISNIDFRAEYYFSENESISLALFNKSIDSPIEKTVPDGSGSALDGFTYQNADSADLNGLEFDFRMNVIDMVDYSGFVSGNIAWVDSEVTLTGRAAELELESSRKLQGQSEYLANIQIGLDEFSTGQSITLLSNYAGERIDKVTRAAKPVMEDGRITVDLVYKWESEENITVSAKVKNLTDSKVSYSQDGKELESYYNGTEISASLEMRF